MNKFDQFYLAMLIYGVDPIFLDSVMSLPYIKLEIMSHQEGPANLAKQIYMFSIGDKSKNIPQFLTQAGFGLG
jgi:hypothetical protein